MFLYNQHVSQDYNIQLVKININTASIDYQILQ